MNVAMVREIAQVLAKGLDLASAGKLNWANVWAKRRVPLARAGSPWELFLSDGGEPAGTVPRLQLAIKSVRGVR